MSSGSFCRLASIGTMYAPRARANPAAIAAVCPKLRRKRTSRSQGRVAAAAFRRAKPSSREPSSTIRTSVGRPAASSLPTTSSSAAVSRGIVCSSS